ncbi:glutaredoxin domain-containing protein [Hyphomicrobiales bacterium 4NK60-0047b]
MERKAVELILYRWAGSWGPFKVKIPCGECALTVDVIKDTLETELNGIPVNFVIREWLSEWWKPLMKGGWHAPIVIVGDKIVSQGHALNRGVLTEAVIEEHVKLTAINGNHIFGKETCPHCVRAKGYLNDANIDFNYHDVVKDPRALYEMISRVKPIVGPKTPITVPQIWLDGTYVGGADQLGKLLNRDVEVNPERGQNSLTAEPVIATA